MKSPLSLFHPAVAAWFQTALGAPTRAQTLAWPHVHAGRSVLLLSPTGTGKTLAAFLAALDRLAQRPAPSPPACRVLYVSPLKALAVDVERNLRAPLVGITATAAARGESLRAPDVGIRTGDTAPRERARMLRAPPEILITTPESLYLLLTSGAKKTLASVETVIVDEIHSMVPTKRGAHLFVSLERLEALTGRRLQRVGLSATQRPLDEVARLLGGLEGGAPRPVEIVDVGERKVLELSVEVPDVDLGRLGEAEAGPEGGPARTIWPHLHARVAELVRAHRSTMVFVNSRRLAERFATALNETAGQEIALAHHGSVAKEKRQAIEDRLKRGELPSIVATSSLELGIDMGAVDLVVQVEAPPSVASGLQRVGRACHGVGATPRGVLFPKHRSDLLAAAAAVPAMRAADVEETFSPKNPLDVLAQQLVAICASQDEPLSVDALYTLIRQAAPFADLPRGAFDDVLDMLAGRYPSEDFAGLRARVVWDRIAGTVRARQGARMVAIVNGGTIPDRGLYGVFLAGDGDEDAPLGRARSRRVGELDEEMVFEMREGDVFLLGASSWRAERITHDRVIVTPAAGEPGRMPFWHGDRAGRPLAFGRRVGALAREIAAMDPREAEATLRAEFGLGEHAARNLVAYVAEQRAATGEVPSDRTIVVERTIDELGDHRVIVLTPFGTRVHAPWAAAVAARLREEHGGDVDVLTTDDGMVFRLPAADEPPSAARFLPSPGDIERSVTEAVASTALFAARFRECAARALLLPRRRPDQRTPLWAQRKRASDLFAVASRHREFPIVLETYRECLRDVYDVAGLVDILRRVQSRRIRVVTVDSRVPSPFAASVLFSYVASFIYDGDAPLAERRAHALTIDHERLRELLGEAELRALLDAAAIEEHERLLQRLTHPAKHEDALHDVLRELGDLTAEEIAARCTEGQAAAWLAGLVRARRAFALRVGSSERFAAAEDAGRYRDALGVSPPAGLPDAFLAKVPGATESLIARYARTHGPFTAAEVAARFGLSAGAIDEALAALVGRGRVVIGEFLPGGTGREHCDAEVLRALRGRSLARLRRQIEPVDAATFARFLPAWQGVVSREGKPPARRGDVRGALLAAIEKLEGCPIPASALEDEILPARVPGYRPWDLDALCASGDVVWAGIEPLGPADGRVALYLADHEPLLTRPPGGEGGELHARVKASLARRGAAFFADLLRDVGGFPRDALEALWDLVWAGEVTNDTFEPLRHRLGAASRPERHGPRARRHEPRPSGRQGPAGSEGRWSLRASRWDGRAAAETERRAALARALLDRHGVVTREAVHAEGIAGGFSSVYEVLKAMEGAGRVRRGYFLEGRGGTQFAAPGADDRLRLERDAPWEDEPPRVLAATDPASAWGAALDWPAGREGAGRPQRAAGALVILHGGRLLGWLSPAEQSLLTFLPESEPQREAALRALIAGLLSRASAPARRALLLTRVDGEDAARSPLAPAFAAAGFTVSAHGLLKRAARESTAEEE